MSIMPRIEPYMASDAFYLLDGLFFAVQRKFGTAVFPPW